jgi:hypothetical protein
LRLQDKVSSFSEKLKKKIFWKLLLPNKRTCHNSVFVLLLGKSGLGFLLIAVNITVRRSYSQQEGEEKKAYRFHDYSTWPEI